MPNKSRVLLYFGSFNPIHNGHVALAEYAIDRDLCDEVVLVVSPRNPLKKSRDLAPEMDRFEMVERACAQSRHPERIKPSVVEFLLELPSYTINTLRHLSENYGDQMSFSILMGGDLVGQLIKWRSYEEILANYSIYVYPREGEEIVSHLDRVNILKDAPLWNFSSTEIREALMRGESIQSMVCSDVAEYIKGKELWSPESLLLRLTEEIDESPTAELYIARGGWHQRHGAHGEALNDLNRALELEPENCEAQEHKRMIEQILAFRYTDIYNP